jgi:hypothetical protein
MTMKRESILEAIRTALTGTVQVGSRIYRSRVEAIARNEAPVLIVEPTDDNARQDPVSQCWIDWSLGVDVIVHTRGQVPEQLSAAIQVDVHEKIMADRTLGGLAMDVWPARVQYLRDQADQTAGWAVMSYTVRYRTRVADLES